MSGVKKTSEDKMMVTNEVKDALYSIYNDMNSRLNDLNVDKDKLELSIKQLEEQLEDFKHRLVVTNARIHEVTVMRSEIERKSGCKPEQKKW